MDNKLYFPIAKCSQCQDLYVLKLAICVWLNEQSKNDGKLLNYINIKVIKKFKSGLWLYVISRKNRQIKNINMVLHNSFK